MVPPDGLQEFNPRSPEQASKGVRSTSRPLGVTLLFSIRAGTRAAATVRIGNLDGLQQDPLQWFPLRFHYKSPF